MASTTSLRVQSPAAATAFMRASENCWVAKRRFSRTRPLRMERGASNGMAMSCTGATAPLIIFAKAVTSCGTVVACMRSSCTAPAIAWVTVGSNASWGFSAATRGALPEAQNGGKCKLLARSNDIPCCSSLTPLMPSIKEWCILMNSANRCPSSPSMMVHSHGGRDRSNGVLCRRPTSSPSSRSPPGQGSAAWRMWYSRSILSSSTHARIGFRLKDCFKRWFHGGANCRWPRNSAIILRIKSLGASSGSLNCSKPPTWLGVARVSVTIQAASRGLRRRRFMVCVGGGFFDKSLHRVSGVFHCR